VEVCGGIHIHVHGLSAVVLASSGAPFPVGVPVARKSTGRKSELCGNTGGGRTLQLVAAASAFGQVDLGDSWGNVIMLDTSSLEHVNKPRTVKGAS